ncbi:MAG: tetratricopeptide repeat protein [Phycisphaerae bacterium]|nr:tetratricopeptide repeat protein [Phycisphaerae bacterium]
MADPVRGETQATRSRMLGYLIGLCLVALVFRIAILREYLAENPVANNPTIDAATYWNWADRIAHGQFAQDTPFFSAPLYPYLLGLLRALGGTLISVYVLQIGMDLVTAILLALFTRRRFGSGVGLLAAGIFLLLQEPASFSLRVLSGSLHLLLVTATWGLMALSTNAPRLPRRVGLGITLGLLCLSYPPALLLVPAVGLWLFWQSRRRLADLARATVPVGIAVLLIVPATVHNYRASGEFFLIQALSGVTLRLGNQPGADGVYHPIRGISMSREYMLHDAGRVYQQATGNPPSWAATDAYFRKLGYDYWRSDPTHAIKLAARKAYWFLTGRNYGDICQPNAEIAAGLADWLRLAPVQTAWLIGPGLVGLAFLLRHPIRHAPEWLMLGVPLFVVVIFWYSPRYRLPAVPVLTVTAAYALAGLKQWRIRRARGIAALVGLAAAIALGFVNRAVGFDAPMARDVAIALVRKGDYAGANEMLQDILRRQPDFPLALSALAYSRHMEGRLAEAYETYHRALALDPSDTITRGLLGALLVRMQRWTEAERELRIVLAATPEGPEDRFNLGVALTAQGKYKEARPHLEYAVKAAPRDVRFLHGMGVFFARQGQHAAAAEWFRRALEIDPSHQKSQNDLKRVLQKSGPPQ